MGLPSASRAIYGITDNYDPVDEESQYQDMYSKLNVHQKQYFDDVISELNGATSNGNCFHLDAFAGTGKSFVLHCILCKVRGSDDVAIAVAWCGIAAMLLNGGTTVHSRFRLPIELDEASGCRIMPSSREGLYIKSAKVIVWDECTMSHKFGLEAVDHFLRDLMGNNRPFGGKIIIMGGDWRQILPVIPHGNRISTVESCIKQSHLWRHFRRYTLIQNMRTDPSELEFSRWLLKLGNGRISSCVGLNVIEIPPENIASPNDLINDIFSENINNIPEDELIKRAIVSIRNDDVLQINETILTKLSTELRTYFSADSVICEEGEEDMYQLDFINQMTPSSFPPHQLNLKVGAIIILLRNLNVNAGLCNGTRLIIRRLEANVIDAEIAIGSEKGERVFIPRMSLTSSDNSLPFTLKRIQFQIRLAFGMTMNKAQGQSLSKVGLLLKEPVFNHGMLYVAFSRATKRCDVRVGVLDTNKQDWNLR